MQIRGLARGDHGHRCQRRQQADELPAAEVFFQEQARQQDGHRGVKRSDDDGLVEPSVLAGEDEQGAGGDVEESGRACRARCGDDRA